MRRTKEYKIELMLSSGANLEILLFSNVEHRWIFTNKYVSSEERDILEKPEFTNDTTLIVNYDKGIAQKIGLTMNIFRPKKRGKQYFVGVDILEGSHLFVEFAYEKQEKFYKMKSVSCGARKRIDLNELKEGLVKLVGFPFPLKDRIENEFGSYEVPFLKSNSEIAQFEFPENYTRL